jgi:hypothetical protein
MPARRAISLDHLVGAEPPISLTSLGGLWPYVSDGPTEALSFLI